MEAGVEVEGRGILRKLTVKSSEINVIRAL
jgi:hypothetical protein